MANAGHREPNTLGTESLSISIFLEREPACQPTCRAKALRRREPSEGWSRPALIFALPAGSQRRHIHRGSEATNEPI
jgi:hypothetical protein